MIRSREKMSTSLINIFWSDILQTPDISIDTFSLFTRAAGEFFFNQDGVRFPGGKMGGECGAEVSHNRSGRRCSDVHGAAVRPYKKTG